MPALPSGYPCTPHPGCIKECLAYVATVSILVEHCAGGLRRGHFANVQAIGVVYVLQRLVFSIIHLGRHTPLPGQNW
jgi:hypothetical protein